MEIKVDISRASIMVLMLKRIMEKNLQNTEIKDKIKNINMSVVLKTGKMTCTVVFKDGEIEILNARIENPSCYIEGSLSDFLNIGLGRYPVVSFLKRKVKFSGSPSNLLFLMKLFKI